MDKTVFTVRLRGFGNPSAFIRVAVERELAGRESGVDAAEERIAASLDQVAREIRSIKLAQQALFAFVDSLAKTLLTCLTEPPRDAYEQAIARGKVRYERFLKSVGAGMVGDSHVAIAKLLRRRDLTTAGKGRSAYRRFGTGWCRPPPSWCWSRSSRPISTRMPMAID